MGFRNEYLEYTHKGLYYTLDKFGINKNTSLDGLSPVLVRVRSIDRVIDR